MALVSRVLTVHAELALDVRLAVLDALESVLVEQGARRVWIDPASSSDLVVLAEFGEDEIALEEVRN